MFCAALLAVAGLAPALPSQSWRPALDEALAKAGLSRADSRMDESVLRLFRKGEFAPPVYLALNEDPWRIPDYTAVKRREFVQASGRPSDLISSGGAWLGWGVRRTLLGSPLADIEAEAQSPGALGRQLEALRKGGIIRQAAPKLDGVPAEVQRAAALLIAATLRAQPHMKAAAARLPSLDEARRLAEQAPDDPEGFGRLLEVYRAFDPSPMAAAAHDLALAAQTAADLAALVPASAAYKVEITTTWGSIVLRGGASDSDDLGGAWLVIDTGGDDAVLNAARAQDRPAAFYIDTSGSDKHLSDRALAGTSVEKWAGRKGGAGGGPASALLGVSVLIDAKGSDLYRTHRPGLGSARLGAAVLLDKEGSDTYDAYTDAQGFGLLGAGILEDLAGDDTYLGFTQVQGVGLTLGVGVLADRVGTDTYTANGAVIDFPSPQSDKHNVSMAQGAAYGRRADYSDGRSQAGGAGILIDGAGDDTYSCGVFGQGVGYWMGVGALWDLAGNDRYTGQWYVQGASAHFAIGILEDEEGNDTYSAPMNMAQGAGHDFSIGLLRDAQGSDRYAAPNLSLGASNANSIGWLLDLAGEDAYQSSGITLGRASENAANSLRSRSINLGVFMDLGGADSYPSGIAWAVNGSASLAWASQGPSPQESALGVFLDR